MVFGTAAFATVFMGLFETYEVLTAYELFDKVAIRPRTFAPWVTYTVQALGALMVALSLTFSYYLAPLVWGALSFLVDPWNYRRGARSLLAELERGSLGVLLRLLLAGLACGLVWESFNFMAPQKWIYTVRGLEDLKLFEMPVLGFIGFPALALDAFAAYAAIAYLFHGNQTWENPDDVIQPLEPRRGLSRKTLLVLVPLHAAFWASIGLLTMTRNIGSIELHHLETLPFGAAAFLETEDIDRPRQFVHALRDPERARRVRTGLGLLGLSDAGVVELEHEALLLNHKGIGYHHGQLLRRLGYRRVEDLAGADPGKLYEQLEAIRLWLTGGLGTLIFLVTVADYPISMITVPGEAVSNSRPPTFAMFALGIFQGGLVFLLEKPFRRWLQRLGPWTATVLVNATIMTLYLWHLTVMVLVIGLAHLLSDVGLHLRPGTGSWWATRPMWIAMYAFGLAIFVPVFGRFEQTARKGAAASVPAWRALADAVGVCAGVVMLALGGIGGEGALGLRIIPVALVLGGAALIVGSPWRQTADA